MNVNLNFFPRLDGDNSQAAVINPKALGSASAVRSGRLTVTRFANLGTQIARTDSAARAMTLSMHKRWSQLDGYDKLEVASPEQHRHFKINPAMQIPKVSFDAATDFTTSGLKKFLGPGEDITRGDDDPMIFVPRPGSPAVIPSRQTLEPGYRTLAYKVREPVGQAQWTDPNSVRGLQRAQYLVEEKEQRAHYYGISWGYSIPETWEADILDEDLLGDRERSANYALDLFRESVSGWGDTDRKIQGYFTVDAALRVLGGEQFSSGNVSAEQMIQRIMIWEQAFKRANGNRKPTGGVVADSERIAMQTTYFGLGGEGPSVWDRCVGYGDKTGLFPWMANLVFDERLNDASRSGAAARWCFHGGSDRESYIEHTETMLFGPFEDFMDQRFIMLRRMAGIVAKRPERFMYVDMAPSA